MHWRLFNFKQLSTYQLWQIYHARDQVFVAEEQIPYPDADPIDLRAEHLLGFNDRDDLVAYARFFTVKSYVSFGRVLTIRAVRGRGYGAQLMKHLLQAIHQSYPGKKIVINLQADKTGFYQKFGFHRSGARFQIAGLDHVKMIQETN